MTTAPSLEDSPPAALPAPGGPPPARYGDRGVLPVYFETGRAGADWVREIRQIPGVEPARNGVRCALDVAPIVARLLGQAWALPPDESPMPGIERYRALGLHTRTYKHQREDIYFLAQRAWAVLAEPVRCLSGDAELVINRGGNARRFSLRDVVHKFNGGYTDAGNGLRCWRQDMPTMTQSVDLEGTVILNRVVAAHEAGVKASFRLETVDGRSIKTSRDHRFSTPEGYVRLADLRVGDRVHVTTRGGNAGPRPKAPGHIGGLWNHPYAICSEYMHHGHLERSAVVKKHRLTAEARLNGLTLQRFVSLIRAGETAALEFLDPSEFHVHHKNENPLDNRPENLEVLAAHEHFRHHALKDQWRNILARQVPLEIKGITEVEPEMMFDLEMAAPHHNFVADSFVVHNSGKSLITLGADCVVDSRKTLIVCPAQARLPWVDEIQTWMQQPAVVLYGRSGREARVRCMVCRGKAVLGEGDARQACGACRGRNGQSLGWLIYDVPDLAPLGVRRRAELAKAGRDDVAQGDWLSCPRHPEVLVDAAVAGEGRLACGLCADRLAQLLADARYVVVNYDLIVRQHVNIGGGTVSRRDDLVGWAPTLSRLPFDVCIADEAHCLRGYTTASKRRGETRAERLLEVVGERRVPRVWMLTGTPFFGFVRDIFWPVEIASGGLWGRQTRMRGRLWMMRYAAGRQGEYGFECKGRTVYAETELVERLGTIMVQRSREDIFASCPPVPHQVVRLELDKIPPGARGAKGRGAPGARVAAAIKAVSAAKRDAILDRLLDEIAEGNKVLVFCFHVESARRTFLALEKAFAARDYRTRMAEVHAKAWLATGSGQNADTDAPDESERSEDEAEGEAGGEGGVAGGGVAGGEGAVGSSGGSSGGSWARSADARYAMAEAFREHVGAGVVVSTIDAMPGSISLRGARSVHFIDLHWSPGAITQAGMRPWHPEVQDLTIIYYLASGTVDDYIEEEVLGKVETLVKVAREKGAATMLEAFKGATAGGKGADDKSAAAIWAKLSAHLRGGDGGDE